MISSNEWQQGDPGRPFPTEADFARSHLMTAQNFIIEGYSLIPSTSASVVQQQVFFIIFIFCFKHWRPYAFSFFFSAN